MPKVKSVKKTYQSSYVMGQMKTWRQAAMNLETVAKQSYRNIRRYLPKYEAKMTPKERLDLITKLSKYS